MRLSELNPDFLVREDDTHFRRQPGLAGADGVIFQCPKCWLASTKVVDAAYRVMWQRDFPDEPLEWTKYGVHYVICWSPKVPQTTTPIPGRWELLGTGIEDLTLRAGSSSVLLTGGCAAHFFIRNGNIEMC
jgi:hypothetical protein